MLSIGESYVSSVKHHYIPQFYLRGFAADDGRLQVFDKERDEFKRDQQTPKTVLFEKHRNTIKLNGIKTDQIEKFYCMYENSLADFFNVLRNGTSKEGLISEGGIHLLKRFVANQFWRMPLLDKYADEYIRTLDLKQFGDRIKINGSVLGEIRFINRLIKEDKDFRYYFRCFLLPFLTFDTQIYERDYDCWRLHTVSDKSGGWDNFLTSDNPIIAESILNMFAFETKLILPLSKTQLITYSPNGKNHSNFPPVFSTKLAMVMNSQCEKYLVGANRDYISKVLELQERVYGDEVNKVRKELFEYI